MGAMPHVLHHPTAGGDGGGSAPLGEERCGRNLWPRFTLFSAPGFTLSNVLIRHPGGEVDAPMAMPFLSGALPLLSNAAAPEQPATMISSGQFTLMLLLALAGTVLVCWSAGCGAWCCNALNSTVPTPSVFWCRCSGLPWGQRFPAKATAYLSPLASARPCPASP
jgi:hypothetical protein